jgi:hypothetical protein
MVVDAILDPRSVGVARYVERLAAAIAPLGVEYRPAGRGGRERLGEISHFHLANSTRAVIPQLARSRAGVLLTIHDVLPRAVALRPVQRTAVLPLCLRAARRIVVHSQHALELLPAYARSRAVIIPFAAPVPRHSDRNAACRALGLALDGPPLFVLPGVLKPAKLVRETIEAAAPLVREGRARLLLAGRVADERLAADARAAGAVIRLRPTRARRAQSSCATPAPTPTRTRSSPPMRCSPCAPTASARATARWSTRSAPDARAW